MNSPSRREFLAWSGFAAATSLASIAKASPLGKPIGIQTFTVRNEMEKDTVGTIKKLAAMGYQAIEVGEPFYKTSTGELRDTLRSLNLVSPSGFYDCPKDKSQWERSIDAAKKLGVKYMITTAPPDGDKNLDAWKRTADFFNGLGEQCKQAGMYAAYHNHNFEFKVMDGTVAFDEFLRRTHPETVKIELDCFWATYAGKDPVDYFNRFPGRFALLHIKGLKKGYGPSTTWPKKGENPFTEVGTGVIDYPRIFKAAPKGGVDYYYVEQDNWDRPPLESARISCDYLKKLSV